MNSKSDRCWRYDDRSGKIVFFNLVSVKLCNEKVGSLFWCIVLEKRW